MKQLQIRELRMQQLAGGGYRHTVENAWHPLGDATPDLLGQFTPEQVARMKAGEVVLEHHYFRIA